MVVYIIISLFAFYGFFHLIQDITIRIRAGSKSCSGKLCLMPHPGDEGLEGKIRCIFQDELSDKLGTDGCLYLWLENNDPNRSIVEKLCCEYPRIVLMDDRNWGRINSRAENCGMECDN